MKKLLIIAIGFLHPHANWSMGNHCDNNDSLKRSFIQMTSTDMANYRPGNNDSADLPNNSHNIAISIEDEPLESDNYSMDVNAKTFPCPYPECNKIYSQKHHLNAHINYKHLGKSKTCTWQGCNSIFQYGWQLNDHINHKHLGRGRACTWPDCTLTFEQEADLVRHMRTHTGEKPYQCEHCAYKCSRNDSLNSHMRTHTGEKPYACEYCSYKCSRNYHLNSHKKACKAAKLAATQILLSMAKDESA